jgi:hypothetical protein
MAFGKIKADAIIRDNGGTEEEITMATIAGLSTSKANLASPTFTGTVTLPATVGLAGQASDITIPDNEAAALEIKEGSNAYMTFITTNSGERVVANKNFQADVSLTDASDLSSGTDLDLSSKNFFHRQVNGNVTYTFSNPPASGTVVGFTLEVDYESGTITWPTSVEWAADTPPALTAAHTSVFVFYTRDNGSTYRGAYLVDFDD